MVETQISAMYFVIVCGTFLPSIIAIFSGAIGRAILCAILSMAAVVSGPIGVVIWLVSLLIAVTAIMGQSNKRNLKELAAAVQKDASFDATGAYKGVPMQELPRGAVAAIHQGAVVRFKTMAAFREWVDSTK